MKLVNKEEFIKMPKGTLYYDYVKYKEGTPSCMFGRLNIKGESIGNKDFFKIPIGNPFF